MLIIMKLEVVFVLCAFSVTLVTGPLVAIHPDAHLLTCYRQSCEMKVIKSDKGENVERWKCHYDGEGTTEKCEEDSFCLEGRTNNSYLRMCIKKLDYIKNLSKGDMDVIEGNEEICTGEPKPKLVPVFFPKGKECYCLENMCNKKIPLPASFDIKDF